MAEKEKCDNDCGACSSNCNQRDKKKPSSLIESANEMSSIKKVYGVVSGKGGVGKSLITALLSIISNRRGFKTAILDGDITGPSIPKMFGLKDKAKGNEFGIFPVESKTGIKIISINLLLEDENAPVIWRGPILAGTIKQFWTDVIWGDVDYMFIDMPPGTADIPLTIFQSIPLDGIIVITSPQELVSMIVSKAVGMAGKMNIPIIGIVENMSYVKCPDCNKEIKVFGESHLDKIAVDNNLELLARLPIDPSLAGLCDKGLIELFEGDWLEKAADKILL